ncbi:hypothetical protein KP509_31G060900 [Ceratopteris richardii]|uniref:RING-type E3 ubiquitin transferase n=1 Tax=Ceratopteris richardii TaxID=49495 RepID=A0A8T2QZ97_CERRI|nr:hypothetical protein KP509_31G060900 [Ceratopteris richardii]
MSASAAQSSALQESSSGMRSRNPTPTIASEDFKCNICLNVASDAVVTTCGHLFCWPCLYTWLHYDSRYKECPVCKGATSEARVIPIYSWGCKDIRANPSEMHNNGSSSIPPRPPAKRIESERQSRQRYEQLDRERQMNQAFQSATQFHDRRSGNELFNVDGYAAPSGVSPDLRASRSGTVQNSTICDNGASYVNYHLLGRETRASWLERLRAMREERLIWPVAFVNGLTSRELLQQRRQAREHVLSPRFSMDLSHESLSMSDPSIRGHAWQTQPGALQRAFSLANNDRNQRQFTHNPAAQAGSSSHPTNASHSTAQYLSTMSSILSSMEVFAKALELASSSSSIGSSMLSHGSSPISPVPSSSLQSQPTPGFNMHNQADSALWQSSMHGLLVQMKRLTMQLQSIEPLATAQESASRQRSISENNSSWMRMAANIGMLPIHVQPQFHHHQHHHYHLDGSLSDRASTRANTMTQRPVSGEGDVRSRTINTASVLGLSPRGDSTMPTTNLPSLHRGFSDGRPSRMFPSHVQSGHSTANETNQPAHRKLTKKLDVTKMPT